MNTISLNIVSKSPLTSIIDQRKENNTLDSGAGLYPKFLLPKLKL